MTILNLQGCKDIIDSMYQTQNTVSKITSKISYDSSKDPFAKEYVRKKMVEKKAVLYKDVFNELREFHLNGFDKISESSGKSDQEI